MILGNSGRLETGTVVFHQVYFLSREGFFRRCLTTAVPNGGELRDSFDSCRNSPPSPATLYGSASADRVSGAVYSYTVGALLFDSRLFIAARGTCSAASSGRHARVMHPGTASRRPQLHGHLSRYSLLQFGLHSELVIVVLN